MEGLATEAEAMESVRIFWPAYIWPAGYDDGMGSVDRPLSGLVVIALVTLVYSAVLAGVLYGAEIVRGLRRLVGRFSTPTPNPARPPIERIGCDVRRLRKEFRTIAPDTPRARRIGLLRAYDDVLSDACAALQIANALADLPLGAERDAERLYVEHQLDAAGIRLHV